MDLFGNCACCNECKQDKRQLLPPCRHPICMQCLKGTSKSPVNTSQASSAVLSLPTGQTLDLTAKVTCVAHRCGKKTTLRNVMSHTLDVILGHGISQVSSFAFQVTKIDKNILAISLGDTREFIPDAPQMGAHKNSTYPTYQPRDTQTRKCNRQDKATQFPVRKDRTTQAGYILDSKREITGCGPVNLQQKSCQTSVGQQDMGIQCQMSLSHSNSVSTQVWSKRSLNREEGVGPVCAYKKDATVQVDTINLERNLKGVTSLVTNVFSILSYISGALDQQISATEASCHEDKDMEPDIADLTAPLQDILRNTPDLTLPKEDSSYTFDTDLTFPKAFCSADFDDAQHYDCRFGTKAASISKTPNKPPPSPNHKANKPRLSNKAADIKYPHRLANGSNSPSPKHSPQPEDFLVDSFKAWSPFVSKNVSLVNQVNEIMHKPLINETTKQRNSINADYVDGPCSQAIKHVTDSMTKSLSAAISPPKSQVFPKLANRSTHQKSPPSGIPVRAVLPSDRSSSRNNLSAASVAQPLSWGHPNTSFTIENEVANTLPGTTKNRSDNPKQPSPELNTSSNDESAMPSKSKTSVLNSICNQIKKLTYGTPVSSKPDSLHEETNFAQTIKNNILLKAKGSPDCSREKQECDSTKDNVLLSDCSDQKQTPGTRATKADTELTSKCNETKVRTCGQTCDSRNTVCSGQVRRKQLSRSQSRTRNRRSTTPSAEKGKKTPTTAQ